VLSVSSSAIVDAALAITALETIVLLAYRLRTGRGIDARAVLANVGAGLFLMLALRAAVTDAGWPWLAICLVAAGVAHVADLSMRWRRH
jgi:hypothetical protein